MLPVDVTERAEFLSDAWIDAARGYLTATVAAEPALQTGSWSVSECFTDAPPGLGLPDDVAAWHFRIDDGAIEVGRGFRPDADLRVRGDYQAVLCDRPVRRRRRPGGRRRARRELVHRHGPDAVRMEGRLQGDRAGLRAIGGLHDHLAARTVENPDLAHRLTPPRADPPRRGARRGRVHGDRARRQRGDGRRAARRRAARGAGPPPVHDERPAAARPAVRGGRPAPAGVRGRRERRRSWVPARRHVRHVQGGRAGRHRAARRLPADPRPVPGLRADRRRLLGARGLDRRRRADVGHPGQPPVEAVADACRQPRRRGADRVPEGLDRALGRTACGTGRATAPRPAPA